MISLMFLCDTLFMFFVVAEFVNIFRDPDSPSVGALLTVAAVMARFMYLICDIIIVWRAWSLAESRYPRAKYILSVCLAASALMLLVSVVLLIVQHFDLTLSIGTAAESLLPLLMLITNVVSTGFIAKITWDSRRTMKLTFRGSEDPRFQSTGRIMILMLESGFIYSFVSLLVFLDAVMALPGTSAFTVVLAILFPQLTALFPTIVIFVNATHRSVYRDFDAPNRSSYVGSSYAPLIE
ncbi:hypothetical protein BDP27DRAFT_1430212 [Rhodocollybia butyracea]|uniref:Uncharacterized protein n=1 Tax=Rhodocollybia butyracea TaxID=206335 RepID=A0A9P5P8N5_9AGAR|nr:hypothetical protein BDP27DRAFT_1430212 [Rhodocollybia butyracea]